MWNHAGSPRLGVQRGFLIRLGGVADVLEEQEPNTFGDPASPRGAAGGSRRFEGILHQFVEQDTATDDVHGWIAARGDVFQAVDV